MNLWTRFFSFQICFLHLVLPLDFVGSVFYGCSDIKIKAFCFLFQKICHWFHSAFVNLFSTFVQQSLNVIKSLQISYGFLSFYLFEMIWVLGFMIDLHSCCCFGFDNWGLEVFGDQEKVCC
ncbi:hypothetical protein Hanom_Chr00s006579g01734651 [Helianthus anomalus]